MKITSQSVETIMGVALSFFLNNTHTALTARVSASAITSLMVDDVHTLYLDATVNTWNKNVWTNCLMLLDVSSNTLLFALREGFTFCGCELANSVVVLHFFVGQNLLTAKVLVITNKLHIFKLLFHLLFNVNEARFAAKHGTLTGFFGKFVETDLVKAVVALLTLPRVNKNSLAKGAQKFRFNLTSTDHIF